MSKLYIPVLAGATREKRRSFRVAQFVEEVGQSLDPVETELIDPRVLELPDDPDVSHADYNEVTRRADGFFIVTPEYNHGYPSSLKKLLDSEFDNYLHKAVAFAGVSSGSWGGVRAIESLVLVTRTLGLVTIRTDVHFPHVKDLFDEAGKLQDEKYRPRVEKVWHELIWMAEALKAKREAMSDN